VVSSPALDYVLTSDSFLLFVNPLPKSDTLRVKGACVQKVEGYYRGKSDTLRVRGDMCPKGEGIL
jgi:hypothetical protein